MDFFEIGGSLFLKKLFSRYRLQKKYFKLIWKPSRLLKPQDIMVMRPYDPFYHERSFDKQILSYLQNGKGFLVVGPPLSGKTRAIFEALKSFSSKASILVPHFVDFDLEKLKIHRPLRKKNRMRVLIIDDFHRFVELKDFDYLLNNAVRDSIKIVATCRQGYEFKKVKNRLLEKQVHLSGLFDDRIVKILPLHKNEGKKISEHLKKRWSDIKFNGTIGSIFMEIEEMEKRYEMCSLDEKLILGSLRKLYLCGIFEKEFVFDINSVRAIVSESRSLQGEVEFYCCLEALQQKDFFDYFGKGKLRVEEIYLDCIFKSNFESSSLLLLQQMFPLLNNHDRFGGIYKMAARVVSSPINKEDTNEDWIRSILFVLFNSMEMCSERINSEIRQNLIIEKLNSQKIVEVNSLVKIFQALLLLLFESIGRMDKSQPEYYFFLNDYAHPSYLQKILSINLDSFKRLRELESYIELYYAENPIISIPETHIPLTDAVRMMNDVGVKIQRFTTMKKMIMIDSNSEKRFDIALLSTGDLAEPL
jgi:hypothetical protein